MAEAAGLARNLLAGMRLAALRQVRPADLTATPRAFVLLALVNLVVLFVLSAAVVGWNGGPNLVELPRALLPVLLLLAVGLLAARSGGGEGMLLLPVALLAAGTVVTVASALAGLLLQYEVVALPVRYWPHVDYATTCWWAAVILGAVARLAPEGVLGRARIAVAALLLLVAPVWLLPQGYLWAPGTSAEAEAARRWTPGGVAEEPAFYAQQEMLARALAELEGERPGIPDLYLIAAGLYGREDVFMKEVRQIETLFRQRFDAQGRTLALINNPQTVYEYPLASLTSLAAALRHVGSIMNTEEDVLVLYLSSHGSEDHRLAVDFRPLRLDDIDPQALKRALDESGIKWKVIVISACYSGGFIASLKDEHALIITASSASKASFGCGSDSDATYLARALFDEELRRTHSFEAAFERARATIERRERSGNHEPSDPQLYVGGAVREKLAQVERRLAALRIP